ncbi:MAG: CvpA family protein [Campylobacterota bacterium]
MELSYIDMILGGLIILLGLKGLMGGMIKEVFGLLAIALGIYLASTFSAPFGTFLNDTVLGFEKSQAANLIAFVVLLIAIWTGILGLGKITSKLVGLSGLGAVDKILGFLFASGKIFVIFSVIAYALASVDFISEKLQNQTKESTLFPLLAASGDAIINIDPKLLQNTKEKTQQKLESLDVKNLSPKQLEEKIQKKMSEQNQTLPELKEDGNDE